jgi:hypothetical protein
MPLWCDLKLTINNDKDWSLAILPLKFFNLVLTDLCNTANWVPEHEKEKVHLILKPTLSMEM